jgi:integrase
MTTRRHFGSIRKLPSGRYQAGYWHGGKRHNAPDTFKTKADAQAWLSVTEADILRGAWINPAAGKVTFRAYSDNWRTIQVHRPKTETQIAGHLRNHINPRPGDRPIAAIRPSEIQALVKVLGETLAPATVDLVYTWTAAVFAAAVADQVIARSPCREIKRTRPERSQVVPPSAETVEKLIEAVPDRYSALIVLGAGTGVRIGEALGVTADRIDWLRRALLVDRQLVGVKAGQPTFGPVKHTRNRPRTIPLPNTVLTALAEHVRVYGTGPEGLLFTNPAGLPVSSDLFSRVWRAAAGPLGFARREGFQQLRHFYASLLIRHGENVKVVAERLGDTPQMALNVYAHLWPGDDDRTRTAVDSVLAVRARDAHDAGL